ncbi:HNH endonuclease [Bradyrhizobium sp. RT3b]|uniref:HNH endonuclease n=1 Tax=Bradyrhizobium sp. RT3b TaxID=3156334 RepID=UPI003397683F
MSILPKPKRVKLRTISAAALPNAHRLRVRSEQDYAHISYDTRLFVWKRDGGACRHCGATENLQYDHIIPRSRGGSGSASNVELLCGMCNNKKKARLFTPTGRAEP